MLATLAMTVVKHRIAVVSVIALALAALSGCASTGSQAQTAAQVEEPKTPQVEEMDALLPQHCEKGEDQCLPPVSWVSKLCNGVHPEVALHMFRGGSPWQRLYARANAPAYNGTGGPSLSDELVRRHEELIALRRRGDGRGDMSVGDTAGYDVLRWNGSCVTLHDGEYSTRTPRRLNHSRVEWRWLGDETRDALQNEEPIHEAYLSRRRECRGATMGRVSKACEVSDTTLVKAIVEYVRSGGELPAPQERL